MGEAISRLCCASVKQTKRCMQSCVAMNNNSQALCKAPAAVGQCSVSFEIKLQSGQCSQLAQMLKRSSCFRSNMSSTATHCAQAGRSCPIGSWVKFKRYVTLSAPMQIFGVDGQAALICSKSFGRLCRWWTLAIVGVQILTCIQICTSMPLVSLQTGLEHVCLYISQSCSV